MKVENGAEGEKRFRNLSRLRERAALQMPLNARNLMINATKVDIIREKSREFLHF